MPDTTVKDVKPPLGPKSTSILVWVSWVLLAVPVVVMGVLANAPEGQIPWYAQGILTGLSTLGGLLKAILPAGLMPDGGSHE